jgi:uncharacterized protein YecT (DUF1311 family)
MKRIFALIFLPFAIGFGPAYAQDVDCSKASTTVEENFCADKNFQAADKKLNAAYAAALASIRMRDLDGTYGAKSFEAAMRASQRAWLAYRDADCKDLVPQEWSGGSGTTSAVLGCMTQKTIERTKGLKERYEEH